MTQEDRPVLVADLLRRIHRVEAWGRGMPLILEKAPQVEFENVADIFIARFIRPPDAAQEKSSVKSSVKKFGKESSVKTGEKILVLLATQREMTIPYIEEGIISLTVCKRHQNKRLASRAGINQGITSFSQRRKGAETTQETTQEKRNPGNWERRRPLRHREGRASARPVAQRATLPQRVFPIIPPFHHSIIPVKLYARMKSNSLKMVETSMATERLAAYEQDGALAPPDHDNGASRKGLGYGG